MAFLVGADNQRYSYCYLQLFYLGTKGGLGNIGRLGGPGKILFPAIADKAF